ncbi:MAG: hypothetical protein ACJ754_12345, partial [Pyrinomonadaceae bacterium]
AADVAEDDLMPVVSEGVEYLLVEVVRDVVPIVIVPPASNRTPQETPRRSRRILLTVFVTLLECAQAAR